MVLANSLKKLALGVALLGSVGVAQAELTLNSWTEDASHLNAVWTVDSYDGFFTYASSLWNVTLIANRPCPGCGYWIDVFAEHAIAPHAGEPAPGPTFSWSGDGYGGLSVRSMRAHDGSGSWVTFSDWNTPPHWDHYEFRQEQADLLGPATLYLTATHPVPEPESYAMLLVGLGLMGVIARRRSKRSD